MTKEQIIKKIEKLSELEECWDGDFSHRFKAKPIDKDLIKVGRDIILKLNIPDSLYSSVDPIVDGTYQIELKYGERELELEFDFNGEIIYLKVDKKYKVNYQDWFMEEDRVKIENIEKIQEMVDWLGGK